MDPKSISLHSQDEGRVQEAISQLMGKLQNEEDTELQIAVLGESGDGASMFINALRGLKNEDQEGWAPTGVVQTTMKPTCYQCSHFPKVALWDLPGVGTDGFLLKAYLEKVEFSKYDFFIITMCEQFTYNHEDLAREIEGAGKRFYVVRSKVDLDLDNYLMSKSKPKTEAEVLRQIRGEFLTHLRRAGVSDPKVFLVNNFDSSQYDFPNLKILLKKEIPALKREAFLLALPNSSEEAIERKKEALKGKIENQARKSILWAAIPIVGYPVSKAMAKPEEWLTFYRKSFGVDDESLEQLARKMELSPEALLSITTSRDLKPVREYQLVPDTILGKSLVMANMICSYIPLLGVINSSPVLFKLTYHMHMHFLEEAASDAKKILKKAMENLR
ncbi:T-cell-specific guanine nucleotide triphosphate-binding protein 2-like [Tachyglossus aculeatus]|uniref:T-cell-specific guanine nucleotide triphosphate-binding protein 2-like n=1 Tax=Tachyglossus aculeatus TaxID=9261 RepID=UPI0018F709B2|nr:T-cell-specific guanine nucleotide triphosphate-binding protein 2-like [Tachyglossus aculeatus]